MSPVSLGDSVFLHFGTSSVTTGAATDADSLPTVSVVEDGVALAYAPSVTNITTGLYMVQIAATAGNGFEAGRRYSVYVTATVGGITGRDGIGEFEVLEIDFNVGVASVVGAVGSVAGNVAGDVLGSVGSVVSGVTLSASGSVALTEGYRANGAQGTLGEILYEILAHLGEASIVGTIKTIAGLDHTSPAATFTLNDPNAPTSITRTT